MGEKALARSDVPSTRAVGVHNRLFRQGETANTSIRGLLTAFRNGYHEEIQTFFTSVFEFANRTGNALPRRRMCPDIVRRARSRTPHRVTAASRPHQDRAFWPHPNSAMSAGARAADEPPTTLRDGARLRTLALGHHAFLLLTLCEAMAGRDRSACPGDVRS
jgi:hypothetical protein